METFVLDSVGTAGGGRGRERVVPGGRVLNFGLWDAGRLRGLGVDVAGGGASEILLLGGVLFDASGRTSGTVAAADVFEEVDFCLLWGGGDLGSVRRFSPSDSDSPMKGLVGCGAY
jgi:hypothetical protein